MFPLQNLARKESNISWSLPYHRTQDLSYMKVLGNRFSSPWNLSLWDIMNSRRYYNYAGVFNHSEFWPDQRPDNTAADLHYFLTTLDRTWLL